eukprot:1428626-Amphidinium_carterae.2
MPLREQVESVSSWPKHPLSAAERHMLAESFADQVAGSADTCGGNVCKLHSVSGFTPRGGDDAVVHSGCLLRVP